MKTKSKLPPDSLGETTAQSLRRCANKRREFYIKVVSTLLPSGSVIRTLEIIQQYDRETAYVYLQSVGHVPEGAATNFAFCDICDLLNDLDKA